MKYISYFVLFISIVLILPSCSTDKINTIKPLDDNQIKEFVVNNQLNATAVENMGNSTIIVFEDSVHMGYFITYVQDKEIKSKFVRTSNNHSGSPLIMATNSFVTILINDEELIGKINKVKVVWDDGYESIKELNNHRALVIPYKDNSENITNKDTKVYFYDAEGNILFQK